MSYIKKLIILSYFQYVLPKIMCLFPDGIEYFQKVSSKF